MSHSPESQHMTLTPSSEKMQKKKKLSQVENNHPYVHFTKEAHTLHTGDAGHFHHPVLLLPVFGAPMCFNEQKNHFNLHPGFLLHYKILDNRGEKSTQIVMLSHLAFNLPYATPPKKRRVSATFSTPQRRTPPNAPDRTYHTLYASFLLLFFSHTHTHKHDARAHTLFPHALPNILYIFLFI